jgi:hypothetical protein
MNDQFPWYSDLNPDERIHQGEIITSCPVARWKPVSADPTRLEELAEYVLVDVIVMSQDCDLENHKISSIILCPAYRLSEWKAQWDELVRLRGQNPTDKMWRKAVTSIAQGEQVAISLIETLPDAFGGEKRVVEFKEVYTLPREFLGSVLNQREVRLMLRPPYREHISQSFARFFMRVGLPTPITIE